MANPHQETRPYVIQFDGQFHVRQCYDKSDAYKRAEEEFGKRYFDITTASAWIAAHN